MIWLSTSTLVRLRDQLRARGQRPSVVSTGASPEAAELAVITAEYGPLCDAMYLMMSADGDVSGEEREVLKGALRNLSNDEIRSVQIEALLDAAKQRIAASGRDTVFHEIMETLNGDTARGEVTFVLAAAIAFADNAVADEENELLNTFAEGLGISEERANELLDSVEQDLGPQQPAAG
jgi:uncharacterized tellurite resistance protein B-like protein